MLNIDKINEEILALESRDTTYAVAEKLAWLYIVRDNLVRYQEQEQKLLKGHGQSDFLKLISGKGEETVFQILDELMSTLNVLHPKLYESVLKKLS
jgi:hypothetical protein